VVVVRDVVVRDVVVVVRDVVVVVRDVVVVVRDVVCLVLLVGARCSGVGAVVGRVELGLILVPWVVVIAASHGAGPDSRPPRPRGASFRPNPRVPGPIQPDRASRGVGGPFGPSGGRRAIHAE